MSDDLAPLPVEPAEDAEPEAAFPAAAEPEAAPPELPRDPAELDATTQIHWEAVGRLIPAPEAEDVELYAVDLPKAELARLGARVRSEHLLTDGLRWCGTVALFWRRATPRQQQDVLGFEPGLLCVAFHELKTLRSLVAQRDEAEHQAGIAISGNKALFARTREEAMEQRNQAQVVLSASTRGDTVLLARIDEATGTAKTPKDLAASLGALSGIGLDLLAHPRSLPARRLSKARVEPAFFQGLAELASKVLAYGEAGKGAATHRQVVTQAEIDAQDGVCAVLLRTLMELFDAGHGKNPEVPQLFPIAARRLFLGHAKKKSGMAQEPSPDSTEQ